MFVVNCFILRKSLLRIEMYMISIYVYFFLPGYIFKGGCEFLFRLWFLLRQGILLGCHLMGEIDRKSLKETGKCFLNNQSFLNLLCTFDTWCLKKRRKKKLIEYCIFVFQCSNNHSSVPCSICLCQGSDGWLVRVTGRMLALECSKTSETNAYSYRLSKYQQFNWEQW